MQLSAISLALTRAGYSIFTPSSIFTSGVTGAWYDPSDINLTWRRNLLTYSEQFDNTAWVKQQTSITANAAVAPNGATTADRVVSSADPAIRLIGQTFSLAASNHTFSVWVKAASASKRKFRIVANQALGSAVGTASSVFEATDTWQLFTYTTTGATGYWGITQATSPDFDFDLYIWGAQLELGSTATPYQRITDGIQDYLQYQAQPVLYRDAAGTLPVTAVEQPVGLMLDKSKGLVLGPELVTNGGFDTDTAWISSNLGTGTSIISNGQLVLTGTDASNRGRAHQIITCVVGKSYKFSSSSSGSASSVGIGLGVGQTGLAAISGGQSCVFTATATSIYVTLYTTSSGGTAYLDNISVRELPGNHAFNSSGNSANFPVLSARYNLLTKTEDFSDAVWSKSRITVAPTTEVSGPSGSRPVFKLVETADTNNHNIQDTTTSYTYVANVAYTVSFDVRAGSIGFVQLTHTGAAFGTAQYANFDLTTGQVSYSTGGTASIVQNGSWYRLSFTATATSTVTGASPAFVLIQSGSDGRLPSYTGSTSNYLYATGADLRVTNDALNQPAYQRVNTATDYDTVGFKPYLRFNGTNQWLQTNSIDFSATDKMFVSAGVRKLSDVSHQIVAELSSAPASNNGVFYLPAPGGVPANDRYVFGSKVTTFAFANTGNSAYTAPITNVVSGIGDTNGSPDQAILRVNGTQAAISTADQGTGNYGNYPLYIGARAGSSLWFNGRLYGLIVAGKLANAVEITETEKYVNGKTAAIDWRDVTDSSSFRWNSATASPDAS